MPANLNKAALEGKTWRCMESLPYEPDRCGCRAYNNGLGGQCNNAITHRIPTGALLESSVKELPKNFPDPTGGEKYPNPFEFTGGICKVHHTELTNRGYLQGGYYCQIPLNLGIRWALKTEGGRGKKGLKKYHENILELLAMKNDRFIGLQYEVEPVEAVAVEPVVEIPVEPAPDPEIIVGDIVGEIIDQVVQAVPVPAPAPVEAAPVALLDHKKATKKIYQNRQGYYDKLVEQKNAGKRLTKPIEWIERKLTGKLWRKMDKRDQIRLTRKINETYEQLK